LFLALVIISVSLKISIDSEKTTITIGDAFVMAIGMMYGIAPCVVATFCHTFLISVFAKRPKIPTYQIVFNVSSTVCVAWLYSFIYHRMIGSHDQILDIIVGSAILTITYFAANSSLVAVAISWSINESTAKIWAKTMMPLAMEFSASAGIATSFVILHRWQEFLPLALAPLLGLVWGYHQQNRSRIIANNARILEAENHLKEQEELYLRTVESLALAVDAKDQTTYGHIRRVRVYAMGLARFIGITAPDELKAIETGALLHDIGKLAVDDFILNKPGKLTTQEFEKIKLHAAAGDEILQQVRFPFPVARYVRCHHERWDGNGYPDGLKGEDIPLGGRILSVADAFDAIRFSRPYKLAMSTEEALEVLRSESGTFFDPKLVQLLVEHIHELEEEAIRESANAPELSFRKYFQPDQSAAAARLVSTPATDLPAEFVRIAEFCNTMSGYFELKDVFPVVLSQLEPFLPFSTCVLYLVNEKGRLEAASATGRHSQHLRGHGMEMGMGISGWVAAYRRPMRNTGPALDFTGLAGDFSSLADALAVPVVYEDEPLGTLSLYAQEKGFYTQEHQDHLQMLADLVAPLIAESKKRKGSEDPDLLDPTTQVPRVSYLAAIGPQLLAAAAATKAPLALIYLEIKNLNQITRLYGGHQGNSLLRRIAGCIKPELRGTDTLVRYGNQGFVALLPGMREEQAIRCADRLKQQIRHEVTNAVQGIAVDFKAGIAVHPRDGATIMTLLHAALEAVKSTSAELPQGDNVIDFTHRP
jgi:diguanylate cyclase (GGDEF)-like protein/putative nucleotidyltransferase with HDIG domain